MGPIMHSRENVEFFIAGGFEAPIFKDFPIHMQPIIVERLGNNYRRWSYEIKTPYKIVPHAPMGEAKPLSQMFPVPSFILLPTPKPMREDSQTIAISRTEFIISNSKVFIILRLLAYCILNAFSIKKLRQAIICILNTVA